MKRTFLDRRSFIAASGLTMGLPWLEYYSGVRPAWSAPDPGMTVDGNPKRLVCIVNGLGSIRDEYVDGSGTNFTLKKTLEPLSDQKSIMTVIRGLNQAHFRNQAAHPRGEVSALSGHELVGNNRGSHAAGGISIDQRIADFTRPGTLRRSIHLGYCKRTRAISAKGRGQKIEPFYSPYRAFESIFENVQPSSGGGGGGGASTSPETQMRGEILTRTKQAYDRLNGVVSASDQVRLQSHLESIDGLISRFRIANSGGGGSSSGCSLPVVGSHRALPARNERLEERCSDRSIRELEADEPKDDAISFTYMDIIAQSFACDVTRIACLEGGELHDHSNHSHQAVSGNRGRNPTAYDWVVRGSSNMAKRINYLVEKLKSIPEGGGSVMDNTLILWMYSMSNGNGHDMHDSRQVLLGNAGGTFSMNRVIGFNQSDRLDHNVLLVSILNAFGVPDREFGLPQWSNGAISDLNLRNV